MVELSVTQNIVSLIITSPVRYHVLYKLCYKTWSRKCIKCFESKGKNFLSIQILSSF